MKTSICWTWLGVAAVAGSLIVSWDWASAQETGGPALIRVEDHPSLQAALDALPAAGGTVVLPPGEFRLEQPLVLTRGDTRVVGAGAATCLLNVGAGKPTLIVRPADIEKNPRARLWRVQLADFRICGDPAAINDKSTEPKSGDGLLATAVDELLLHNLAVDHHGGNGIRLVNCSEDPRVSDSIVTYNRQTGLALEGCHDIVVSANQFEENQDAVRCTNGFNLCMNGNNLDDHLGNGVVIENTYGSVLSGNMIEECRGTAIVLDRDCYGITLSANVIAHNSGGGIELRDAWGCAVSANTFTINGKFGLLIGPAAGRIAVGANSFCDSFHGDEAKRKIEQNHAGGIVLNGAADVAVTGNVFSGLSTDAIAADAGCRRILVQGNIICGRNALAAGGRARLKLDAAASVAGEGNLVETDSPR